MAYLFETLAAAVNIYSLLCFIRIIMTWIPGAAYSGFGRFLSRICDPFMNLFRNIRWLQMGALDFSPALAIGILTAASTILSNIAETGRIYLGGIISVIIGMVWSILGSLGVFLLILLIIRYIVLLARGSADYYNSIWSQLDSALSPVVFRIAGFFSHRRPVSYKTALLVSILMLAAMLIAGQFLTNYIIHITSKIPI